ncbi:MAG: hypothetical protein ACOYU3_03920 [Bacillota bacterium]
MSSSSKRQGKSSLNKKECEIANEIGINMQNNNKSFSRSQRNMKNEFANEYGLPNYTRGEQSALTGNARSNTPESENQSE